MTQVAVVPSAESLRAAAYRGRPNLPVCLPPPGEGHGRVELRLDGTSIGSAAVPVVRPGSAVRFSFALPAAQLSASKHRRFSAATVPGGSPLPAVPLPRSSGDYPVAVYITMVPCGAGSASPPP